MKVFVTYLIATLLFGLCILEKQSVNRESKEENISNKLSQPSADLPSNQSYLIPSNFQQTNSLIADDGVNSANFQVQAQTDSLGFYQ